MSNRDRLREILGPNSRVCSPTSGQGRQQVPSRNLRQASQQRTLQTVERYGNFLSLIQAALQYVGRLSPMEIQNALNALTRWLGQDDPLSFLHSLQQGQLFILLGEVAPVVAQWLSDGLGVSSGGGRQSRRGGYVRDRVEQGVAPISLQTILTDLTRLYGGLRTAFPSAGLPNIPTITFPSSPPIVGGGGAAGPTNIGGPTSTIEIPDNTPPNVLEIPSQF